MCINCRLTEAMGRLITSAEGNPNQHPLRLDSNRRQFVNGSLALVAAVSLAGASSQARSQQALTKRRAESKGPPSVAFRNGAVYTVNSKQPWAEAVAVRDKHIIAVGSNAEIDKITGPETKVVDLNGRMMLPGFVEGHTHPLLGSFFTSGIDLQVPTRDDALELIAQYAKDNPTGPVRGFGWRVDMFPPEGPSKADLDEIVPDRPAFFFAIDAHSMWVNSKALELAGINRETPDPIPGFSYYARDAKGEPTGYVMELPSILATVNAIDPITVSSMGRFLQDWLPKAAAAGITTVLDAGVPPVGDDQTALIQIYTDLEKNNRLPFRVVASYAVKGPPIENVVREVHRLSQRINTELVQARMLKIFADGTQGGYTAVLLEPYTDKPDTLGESPFSQDEMARMIMEAEAVGIDVHVHACGEGAIRMTLNAFEAALKANPSYNRRHSIAHLVLIDDQDIPRFGKLGVTAQFSANWMSADPDTVDTLTERYGPERQKLVYRPRSVLKAGGTVSFGADWPAAGYFATYKPLDAIQVAVTRQLIGNPDAPILEPVNERMEVEEAIHANTLGSAYQLRMEDEIGSIETGKLADLIVLDKNILSVDKYDIAKTHIDMTMMNGRFTHK